MTLATSLFAPVEEDLRVLTQNLKNLIGARHPILFAAAEHLFEAEGKRVRPAIVLLISRATQPDRDITERHRRLAEITEMIHTASLVHDDIVDESQVRRGLPTVHSVFGNRVAVLAGDFLFAQSSWYLANLDSLAVVKLLSEVIKDFAEGEIRQGLSQYDADLSIEAYLDKSYYKTASLIANSSKAAGILSGVDDELAQDLYDYGRHLGLAFQIVDDILDYTSSTETLGKPAFADLRSGNLTAPVLYALEEEPSLESLIAREFAESGDLDKAIAIVEGTRGIDRARKLAAEQAKLASTKLDRLPQCPHKRALLQLIDYVLSRLY
ncbi:MAG: solanesyl diphosphate synthase [Cyanobacteriota bacterium]|nr:solanesyl diphosphate synthase [Cyanobacteriota bacterium]